MDLSTFFRKFKINEEKDETNLMLMQLIDQISRIMKGTFTLEIVDIL